MKSREKIPGDRFVQSLARGLSVIKTFGADMPRQTLTEVAERAGLDRAGARRILLTLETLGYLAREGRSFFPTPRILDLGYSYLASIPWWSVAERKMSHLASTINESVTLGVLDRTRIVLVACATAQNLVTINLTIGRRSPAYCTAIGRILLGGLTDAHLNEILREIKLLKNTKHTVTSIPELKRIIRRDFNQGWSIVNQEYEPSICSIAVPVYSRVGQLLAAMCVVGTPLRTTPEKMKNDFLPRLTETVQNLWD
jgi:IclR family pca regulon transcriptional regulator